MERTRRRIFTLCLLFCGLLTQYAAGAPAADLGVRVAESGAGYDGYLVAIPGERLPPALADEMEPVAEHVYWTDNAAALEEVLFSGMAEYIEPNYVVTLCEDGGEMGGDAIRSAYAARYGLDGTGSRIAVIDSGVDPSNRNLRRAAIVGGYDYVRETTAMSDDLGHGTDIVQIIAGDGDDGAAGVARGAEVVVLRCFSESGGGTVRLLVQAITDAVDMYGCNVINMSWGVKAKSEALYRAIRHAYEAGAILVAAAGNVEAQFPQGTLVYPATWGEVIGVGAVNDDLSVAGYSQKTEAVTVCAPGTVGALVGRNGEISLKYGTSYAAPCIAAMAAIVKGLAPFMEPEDILALLRSRAEDLGDAGYDTAYGYGFLRIDRLLAEPWRAVRYDNDEPVLYGWQISDGGSRVLIAIYDDAGRLKDVSILGSEEAVFRFEYAFPMSQDAQEYAALCLNGAYVPLTESLRFST